MIKFLIATYFFLFLTSDFLEITTTSSAVPGTGCRPVARSHTQTKPSAASLAQPCPWWEVFPSARLHVSSSQPHWECARAIFRSITTLQCTEKSRPIEISRISRWFRHWFSFDVASAWSWIYFSSPVFWQYYNLERVKNRLGLSLELIWGQLILALVFLEMEKLK